MRKCNYMHSSKTKAEDKNMNSAPTAICDHSRDVIATMATLLCQNKSGLFDLANL